MYGAKEWQVLLDTAGAESDLEPDVLHKLIKHASSRELNTRGYLTIPKRLRDYAGITDKITIVGVIDKCEVWDSDNWNEENSWDTLSDEEKAKEAIAEMVKDLEL